jgi:dTDP-4-amino-4,6-dideoxygalactose transaminase
MIIPFNKTFISRKSVTYINEVLSTGNVSGNGKFTKLAEKFLMTEIAKFGHSASKVLLTNSGTSALEMAAKLLNLSTDDEVIVPFFAFTSTANAFIQNSSRIVFADIDKNNLCLDLGSVKENLTEKTKAVCLTNYAGINPRIEELKIFLEQRK